MRHFNKLLVELIFLLAWFLVKPVNTLAQTNQSDVTGPNPIETTTTSSAERRIVDRDLSAQVKVLEQDLATEYSKFLNISLFGSVPTTEEISLRLCELAELTGQKTVMIYATSLPDRLQTLAIYPASNCTVETVDPTQAVIPQIQEKSIQKIVVPAATREELFETISQFLEYVTLRTVNPQAHLQPAQQLYQWLIAPLAPQLEEQNIDLLVFAMGPRLRSLPIAALHDGDRYLVEKYALALVPSFGLTDVGYADVRQTSVLAMGASEFTEQEPLPFVPTELQTVTTEPWQGESFLNAQFTVENFINENKLNRFGVIHLATHADFRSGRLDNSYIQFSNRRLPFSELRQVAEELGWSSAEVASVELLVLSACKTALGNPEAELGFAGLAVQSGVKSALASLWYVSDLATTALMSEFYQQLNQIPIKAQALRQAQLKLLRDESRIEEGKLVLSQGEVIQLPPTVSEIKDLSLSHPFFWSAFTLIGNWN